MTVRLLDLNIWNYNEPWETRRNLIVQLVRDSKADVVALQEIQCLSWLSDPRHQAAKIHRDLLDFEMIWRPACHWAPGQGDNLGEKWEGLTILSRYPIVDQSFCALPRRPEPPSQPWTRGVLGALVRSPDGPLWIFDTHRSGNRTYATPVVFDFVTTTSAGRPFALTGDFNVLPESDDVRYLTGQIEIDGKRGDLIDAWAQCHPDDPGPTFYPWEPTGRIDYVFVSRSVAVAGISIVGNQPGPDGTYPSDHMGLLADLDIAQEAR